MNRLHGPSRGSLHPVSLRDNYCILNGHLISVYEPSIPFTNRAFRYGDSLFESIRVSNNQVMFLKDHLNRLKLGMTVLRMNLPAELNTDNVHDFIRQLLRQNTHAPHARVRLTVFRNDGGHYAPISNDISFLIESEQLDASYELNQRGYWVDIYADIKKPVNKLSNVKTGNALMNVMAGVAKHSMKLDECLLVNEHGSICESISSNIFVVKNGTIFTVPLTDGCVAGVMRRQIMHLASENRILTFESPVTTYTLINADEIFLTNTIQGIRWVGQFKDRFYTNKMAQFFAEKLQQIAA